MLYCSNPSCSNPFNLDSNNFCQSCGSQSLNSLFKNRFRVLQLLGEGGFGRTYEAIDTHKMNDACVIKQFVPQVEGTAALEKATELFKQEAKRLFDLGEHPQIPRLIAYFEDNKRLYLVQEFIQGQNLLQELHQQGAFSEKKITQLLHELLPVLQFVHERGVIHRDIKPENIMRRQDGKLMLIDFGVSKQVTGTVLSKLGTMVGTSGYAPMEQMRGQVFPASDLYSLGVTCLRLLTNCLPDIYDNLYDALNRSWLWKKYLPSTNNVSNQLEQVLDKLIQDSVKERYQSAQEVLKDLESNIYYKQGLENGQRGKYREAIDCFNKVIRINPDNTEAYKFRGIAYCRLGKNQEAIEDFQEAANLYLKQGKTNEYQEVSQRIKELEKGNAPQPDNLSSEVGIDYTKLRDLLATGKWKEADQETWIVMLKIAGREKERYLRDKDLLSFPSVDLHTIDQLWVKYSNGRFGFSVTNQIWQSVGGNPNLDNKNWKNFGERVGWRVKGNWKLYEELTFTLTAPIGQLPRAVWSIRVDGRRKRISALMSKLKSSTI
ncbi:GUN4 domain-containing protein [Aerosakkonemataceae cyanobacterium BLCC-F154]|uniref:non-specific serine/threonine protein kinase n=1 Tax=Floridaenema fluviatile BLCC-F154 TaxID=3153640 RepID=A0ABV4YFP2_9CYAN